ncbi:MAG: alpha/beta fold hydrolase [Saccharopolyspora sp.]|uniref:alpha/beta hydrolase n=1 Tax=Saccharopolyspora sp. TaxID=33915 RepID=UPI0025FE6429|nr:alpha/beta fold hydrolase [Saccharopolyspora sp.]MBQ6644179.1 alpha/beta fold hydrolase [Saccharopolyspora sp.]
MQSPKLRVLRSRADTPGTIVLVLHGGRATSHAPARGHQLAYLRMRAVARSLHSAGAGCSAQVWLLRNRFRGWNEPDLDAVADARWALERIQREHPQAGIVLVGHSLGGRVALRLAGEPGVRGVCALAPWVEQDEPVEQLRGKPVLIAHGDEDRVTSAAASADYAVRARRQPDAPAVTYRRVPRSGHAMLRRRPEWNALTRRFVRALLAGEEPVR